MLPDEALSSWVARIAARFDLSAERLVGFLLADGGDAAAMVRCLDYHTVAPLEAALVAAAGQPAGGFAERRLMDPAANPQEAWPRINPAWCPLCVAEDIAAFGEVYSRAIWGLGGVLLCPRHRCLLIAACPRCLHRAGYHPVNGRLRIWCWTCGVGADTALKPDRIPFWPYGTPQQQRTCVTIRLSSEARPLLMRIQTDILSMLVGEEGQGSGRITGGRAGRRVRPHGPWALSLKASNVFAVLRKLVFVMLGPLWEDTSQAAAVRTEGGGRWMLPPDWTPGSLPPEIAAPALLAATTFLAAESGTRLAGITWNPQLLIAGENDAIKAETLLWHLNGFNARLVQDLFGEPFIRPFALLLTALRADRQGLGAAREAARRRLGAGGARRREREAMQSRLRMSKLSQGRPENPAQACKPADRFSFSRLIEGFPTPPTPTRPRATWQEAVAVYVVIGWEPRNGDILAPPTDWLPELLRNRYIRLWIFRHRHLAAAQLISTLADAIDTARAQDRDIMLPELSAAPLVSTPPIKPAAQGRQRRNHRARGV